MGSVQAGPSDPPFAAAVANSLLAQPADAPVLELTGPGAVLSRLRRLYLGPRGWRFWGQGHVWKRPPSMATLATPCLARRHRDSFWGPYAPGTAKQNLGARAYLAVLGAWDVPHMLGSPATDLDADLGLGRLTRGAMLTVRHASRPAPETSARSRDRLPATWPSTGSFAAMYKQTPKFVPSGETTQLWGKFPSQAFKGRITSRSNRTAAVLEMAPDPALAGLEDLTPLGASRPLAPGAIQRPPSGNWVVFWRTAPRLAATP